MREIGYVERKTIVVDRLSSDGDLSRLLAFAVQLAKARPGTARRRTIAPALLCVPLQEGA